MVLAGQGGHIVKNVTSRFNNEDGFFIAETSRENNLNMNTAFNNCGNGFDASGPGNKFVKNLSECNQDRGYEIDESSFTNKFDGDMGDSNFDENFEVGSDFNRLIGVSATNALDEQEGIDLEGNSNIVKLCFVDGNSDEGVEIDGDNNVVTECEITNNNNDGVEVDSFGNIVSFNFIAGNFQDGVDLQGDASAEETEVFGNVVMDNGSDKNSEDNGIEADLGATMNFISENSVFGHINGFDLRDFNPDCDSNIWVFNEFDTKAVGDPIQADNSCIN